MNHPTQYTHQEWASWYHRAQTHTKVAPGLTRHLRSGKDTVTRALLATAAATLAELDEDIVAGEFLAQMMETTDASTVVDAIVGEMAEIAQDLLQAIVDARVGTVLADE